MKKMLFVNGTYNDIPLIESARKLGFYVITSGNDPEGEGHPYGDEYCRCDYTDKEAMLRLAKEKNVDAVCSCGNDFCATTAAYVCEQLHLPGHDSYATSRVFHEKDEFKKMVKELGLSSPTSVSFTNLDEAMAYIQSASFPKIIKPVDLGGGKGISVARNLEEAVNGLQVAFAKSKLKHIVVEDYIQGTQHALICYIKDKKIVFDYSTNDYSYLNPYMVWIGCGYPADGYDKVRSRMIEDVEKMAAYKNMADGFLTIQYMMMDGQYYYLETMRRCLGNMHYKAISKDCGTDLYELYVATEAGLDVSKYIDEIHMTGLRSGFMGIYAKENGILDEIEIDDRLKPYVYDSLFLHKKGDVIDDYLGEKLGNVWYSFNSEEERNDFIRNRYDLIRVKVV